MDRGFDIIPGLVATLEGGNIDLTQGQQDTFCSNGDSPHKKQHSDGARGERFPAGGKESAGQSTSRRGHSTSAAAAPIPGIVLSAILSFLPAPEAVSLILRSRSKQRHVEVGRHCLQRMETVFQGVSQAKASQGTKDQLLAECVQPPLLHPLHPRPPSTLNLGDMEQLDLIFKVSHAHVTGHYPTSHQTSDSKGPGSNKSCSFKNSQGLMCPELKPVRGQEGSGRLETGGDRDGGRADKATKRLSEQCHGLLSILAAVTHRFLLNAPGVNFSNVGILTDCLHPGQLNHVVDFGDSVASHGMHEMDTFPLAVVSGVCVLDLRSPVYVCLPCTEANPIRFLLSDK
ncbi:unnamed protein product, partial [Discosporangium mesarthrocarpum]